MIVAGIIMIWALVYSLFVYFGVVKIKYKYDSTEDDNYHKLTVSMVHLMMKTYIAITHVALPMLVAIILLLFAILIRQ